MTDTGIVSTHKRDVRADCGGQPGPSTQALQLERNLHAGRRIAPLDLGEMPTAAQARLLGQLAQRDAHIPSSGREFGHAQKFAHAEHSGKANVRHDRTDRVQECSHIPNMAEKPRKARHDLYADYRQRSGWYLAAWRDFAGLTLEDLADELEKSKGYVSDLETGASRADRPPTRFNRDLVERVAQVVGTTGGRLIDVNPFEVTERMKRLNEAVARLDPEGQDAVLEMAERWLGRAPTVTGTNG